MEVAKCLYWGPNNKMPLKYSKLHSHWISENYSQIAGELSMWMQTECWKIQSSYQDPSNIIGTNYWACECEQASGILWLFDNRKKGKVCIQWRKKKITMAVNWNNTETKGLLTIHADNKILLSGTLRNTQLFNIKRKMKERGFSTSTVDAI